MQDRTLFPRCQGSNSRTIVSWGASSSIVVNFPRFGLAQVLHTALRLGSSGKGAKGGPGGGVSGIESRGCACLGWLGIQRGDDDVIEEKCVRLLWVWVLGSCFGGEENGMCRGQW
jgi:hypothetical protein